MKPVGDCAEHRAEDRVENEVSHAMSVGVGAVRVKRVAMLASIRQRTAFAYPPPP